MDEERRQRGDQDTCRIGPREQLCGRLERRVLGGPTNRLRVQHERQRDREHQDQRVQQQPSLVPLREVPPAREDLREVLLGPLGDRLPTLGTLHRPPDGNRAAREQGFLNDSARVFRAFGYEVDGRQILTDPPLDAQCVGPLRGDLLSGRADCSEHFADAAQDRCGRLQPSRLPPRPLPAIPQRVELLDVVLQGERAARHGPAPAFEVGALSTPGVLQLRQIPQACSLRDLLVCLCGARSQVPLPLAELLLDLPDGAAGGRLVLELAQVAHVRSRATEQDRQLGKLLLGGRLRRLRGCCFAGRVSRRGARAHEHGNERDGDREPNGVGGAQNAEDATRGREAHATAFASRSALKHPTRRCPQRPTLVKNAG